MGGGNMKYQLIMLPNQPILVSDEKITKEDIPFNLGIDYDSVWQFRKGLTTDGKGNWKKIIAGIPELPSIDFSVLSEEDCKKIGWVDVEKLANDYSIEVYPINGESRETVDWIESQKILLQQGFISGFKAAQSLNEKKYSEEDVKEITYQAAQYGMWYALNSQHNNEVPKGNVLQWFQNRFAQPKVFQVEVEMKQKCEFDFEKCSFSKNNCGCEFVLKITNNSIKITKIL